MVQYVWRYVYGSKNAGTEQEKAEVTLVEYYRFARNRFVHAVPDKQPKLERLKGLVKRHPALKKLDGPNAYREHHYIREVLSRCSEDGVPEIDADRNRGRFDGSMPRRATARNWHASVSVKGLPKV